MHKRLVIKSVFLMITLVLIFMILVAFRRIGVAFEMMQSETPPVWYSADSKKLISKKRECRDFTTTILKMILTDCDTGFPTWSNFINCIRIESEKLPPVDYVVGITSGGWLIADIICKIQNRAPAIKLKYSRYNNKKSFKKTMMFLRGHQTAKEEPDWTTEEHKIQMSVNPDVIRYKTCLLIDDSIGSGATINVCRRYLHGCGVKSVFTYVFCATKPELVDMYYTDKHFVIFPWGLDV
jgi:hypoxanthine phosphoribosyltransferase